MVNLHLKQRALERLRYRPEYTGLYATGTYVVADRPDPNVVAPAFEQPGHVFIDNSAQRRRAQAKSAWIVFLIGVASLILIFLLNLWRAQ